MSPACHALLTIRCLTGCACGLGSRMHTIKIKRTITIRKPAKLAGKRRFLQFAQNFFARENHLEFVVEALLFGLLLAIAAWPIVAAVGAINEFLRAAAV